MIDPPLARPLGVTNRLAELRGSTGPTQPFDVEIGAPAGPSLLMQEFFTEAREIKSLMDAMRASMREIENSHDENLKTISTEKGREWSDQLEHLMQAANGLAAQIRTRLKEMADDNTEHAQRGVAETVAESRIRTNTYNSLTHKFVDLMSQYQDLQTKYKNKYRARVERQYRIVKPDATPDEISRSVEDPKSDIFTEQILAGAGHAAARNALADIQERHRDILRLESSINEMHQLFLEMSLLVEAQGELIDQIEHQIGQGVTFTGRAVEELRYTSEMKKKRNERVCWAVVVLIIIILIVFIPALVDLFDE